MYSFADGGYILRLIWSYEAGCVLSDVTTLVFEMEGHALDDGGIILGDVPVAVGEGYRRVTAGDAIWLRDKEIVGLDTNASLKVSAAGNYVVNETELKAKADLVTSSVDDDGIWNACMQLGLI